MKWKIAPLPGFESFYDDLRQMSPTTDQVLVNTYDVDERLAAAATTIAADYRYPHQVHGPLGASVSTAWVKDNTATVWSSTQGVYQLRGALATVLNMPEENVHVIFVEGSGHYGFCAADNASLDAAVLSQAVGKPVRVQYTQADEHNSENFRPAYTWTLRGAVDASGAKPKIVAWDRTAWTSSRGNRPGPPGNMPTGIQLDFRLDHLDDPRLYAVTEAAAKLASWQAGPSAAKVGSGRFLTGRGIASSHYEGTNGYNGLVVAVTVDYPVIRFTAMPKFDFQIINRIDQPVLGAGEVLITNVPAAIGNAVFDATGVRMRQVPFTPARVKAALAA